jgi:hypothetical protein
MSDKTDSTIRIIIFGILVIYGLVTIISTLI